MESVNISETSIQVLNDDCLIEIFKNLSVLELINIERVCTRWTAVSYLTLKYNKVRYRELRTEKCLRYSMSAAVKNRVIKSIFKRCGKILTSLHWDVGTEHDDEFLSLIAQFCPSIEELYITGTEITGARMKAVAEKCKKLKTIKLCGVSGDFEEEFSLLLENSKNLVTLKIVDWEEFTGKCLEKIRSEILSDLELEFLTDDSQELSISDKFGRCVKSCSITSCELQTSLQVINNLKNLKSLELCYDNYNNGELREISENCKLLENVLISGFIPEAAGIDPFLNLQHLKSLNILNDNVFDTYPSLWQQRHQRILSVEHITLENIHMSATDIANIIELSPRLNKLNVQSSIISAQTVQILAGSILESEVYCNGLTLSLENYLTNEYWKIKFNKDCFEINEKRNIFKIN